MKYLQVSFVFTEDLSLKSLVFDCNETGMNSDTELLELLAICLLKSIKANEAELCVQDLLNKHKIIRNNNETNSR